MFKRNIEKKYNIDFWLEIWVSVGGSKRGHKRRPSKDQSVNYKSRIVKVELKTLSIFQTDLSKKPIPVGQQGSSKKLFW